MKILFNNVLIKRDRDNDELLIAGGKKLYLDTSFEKERHSVCTGTVVQAPERLIFDRMNMNCALYDTDVEIQPGDRVVFHYLAISSAREQFDANRMHIDPMLEMIPYDRIFVAYRGTEVIPVNGIVLVEPLDETIETSLIIPDSARTFSKTRGIVRYMGTPIRAYRDYPEENGDNDEISIGDVVCYKAENCIPLEYDLHQTLDKGKRLFRMQRRDIDAILLSEVAL